MNFENQLLKGDVMEVLGQLPDNTVQCCVTSPPYWGLRDYGDAGQLGLEKTPGEYVANMVAVFREVGRVLRKDGTCWLNLGDVYAANRGGSSMAAETLAAGRGDKAAKRGRASGFTPHRDPASHGLKHKDLVGIPWRVAFALQADGWYLRQDIIWAKPAPMPESVTDRCTKAHEYIFLLTKSAKYYYDAEAILEPATGKAPGNKKRTKGGRHYEAGADEHRTAANLHNIGARDVRNKRSVWTVSPQPYAEAHFATFPPKLIEPCILAGSKPGDIVLDPFGGSGTTAWVARKHGRKFIHIDLSYHDLAARRLAQQEMFA